MTSSVKSIPRSTPRPTLNAPLIKTAVAICLTVAFVFGMGLILEHAPEPIGSNASQIAQAALVTVQLTLLAGILGVVIGTLAALGKASSIAPLRWLCSAYIWVARGTPLLLQILFTFFALPVLLPSLEFSDFTSATIALAFNVGAYNAEAIRSGLLSVPKGQIEAADALGLSKTTLFFSVVFPQALRISLPPLVNNGVSLLKDSSLAYAIGVVELSNAASRIQSATFEPVPVLLTSAAIYLILTTSMTQVTNALEQHLSFERK
ncbi:amino acid ABC transporter permease [Pseudomonas sp. NC26]|uniref:Glutamate/aspartate import permease protein GltK n=2 Tax=Pseudomonas TaxID=286 RepID=A0A7W2QHX1_PSEPU|nr:MULTISPECIES: amino acid ABC transporter permease [Pseudomonas]MBA6115243.1 amino acid ABC transporter permease [Pseudomonas putida]MCZ9639425.1 amino acid ABC transporter permease [Pseudomonas putida]MEC4874629.1 amino acid ABC transporter permease [Pseudomonas sp. NC26]QNL88510.1 Amino acid ABC transporter permease protein [Pseudomonas putida]